jgi:hypothetical protein
MASLRRFNVVRKIASNDPNGRPYWAPVGQISIWTEEGKAPSGKLRMNHLTEEFHVFYEDPTKRHETAAEPRPSDPDADKMFGGSR